MLKLANGSEQNEQRGGQLDNKAEIQTLDTNLKTKDDISDVRAGVGYKSGKEESSKEENADKTGEEKPRLYVNKPLSEMPFDTSKVPVSSKRKS